MGILGPVFEMAAVGALSNAGQSQENVFDKMLSHASDVGNVGVTPPRRGGFGLG